jgi:hypothetical protein
MTSYYTINGKNVSRYKYELFQCISFLHMTANGSMEGPSIDDLEESYYFLKARLKDWQKIGSSKPYDNHVRRLCKISMNEYRYYLNRYILNSCACEGRNLRIKQIQSKYVVFCKNCRKNGKSFVDRNGAIKAWNDVHNPKRTIKFPEFEEWYEKNFS